MIISTHDIWESAKDDHTSYIKEIIKQATTKPPLDKTEEKVRNFITDNQEIITSSTAERLEECIENFNRDFPKKKEKKAAIKLLKNIFNYSEFIKKPKNNDIWCAYKLCGHAKYRVCPYCHISPIETTQPNLKKKGYRPNIDHFYAKANYPFLSLTLGNFIPCCEKCNGRQMKGTIDFSEEPHLNPMLDEESIEFSLAPKLVDTTNAAQHFSLEMSREDYKILLQADPNSDQSKASLTTFQLHDRYQEFSNDAYYLARRLRGLPARLEMLKNLLEVQITIEENLEFRPCEYKNKLTGKMRICIAKQFGLL